MKLFFGRININQEPRDQLSKAYYYAEKGTSYFGELNTFEDFSVEPVYVFMIANSQVHLWRASHWGDDGRNLYFEAVKQAIEGMTGAWLAAIKYFYMPLDLIIFTIKRPYKKAFFQLTFDPALTEELLLSDDFYNEETNYRKIRLSADKPEAVSRDLQLYLERDEEWKLAEVEFFDPEVQSYFRDNTAYVGKGRKRKDNTLRKVINADLPHEFDADELPIWQLYDTFFCDYNAAEQVTESFTRAFYKYSPGPQASRWPGDLVSGMIQIDFSEKDIDLDSVNSRQELNVLMNLPPESQSNQSWNLMLFKEAHAGDVVFANSGLNKLVGIGIITGDYQFDAGAPFYRHQRAVQWIADKPWEYTSYLFPSYKNLFRPDTFSPTLPYKDILAAYVKAYPEYESVFREKDLYFVTEEPKVTELQIDEEDLPPLNRILYGPPGTGKTYHTIDEAVKIIDGESADDHQKYKERFDTLKGEGQIEFVTFHQNYSYEDFMVGLRPDAEFDELRFKPFKGIFYQLVQRAKANYLAAREKRSLGRGFEEVFAELVAPLEKGERVTVTMASGKKFFITDVENGTIRFEKEKAPSIHTLSVSTLQAIVEGNREFNSGLGVYYQPLVKELRSRQEKETGPKETMKRYVLIIDEINRANISRVFGELITLLEDDKRLGRANALLVTLPNGEQNFSVPPNLFIVGTMNTADKSIALLDIALRRRFEFIGYYPDLDVLVKAEQEPKRVKLLKFINQQIYQKKKSADYLIGHAYFLSKDSLEDILLKKVIPLLSEYFNNRSEDVSAIFEGSDWKVKFSDSSYRWEVSEIKKDVIPDENI
jgi:hypothetical protein